MAVVRAARLIKIEYGSGPTQITKCVAVSWQTRGTVRTSKSDGDIGISMAAVTGWNVSGTLYFLNHQDCATIQNLSTSKLIVTYKAAGGTTKTRTFGVTSGAGVRFGRFRDLPFSEGGGDGNQPRIAVPFTGVFAASDALPSDFMAVA